MMDYANHQFVYSVDGRVPKKRDGLLLTLSLVREADPSADAGIDVLVTSRARLSEVFNLIGKVIKADYSSYRVYVFDSDKRSMVELRYGKTEPFPSSGK